MSDIDARKSDRYPDVGYRYLDVGYRYPDVGYSNWMLDIGTHPDVEYHIRCPMYMLDIIYDVVDQVSFCLKQCPIVLSILFKCIQILQRKDLARAHHMYFNCLSSHHHLNSCPSRRSYK